MSPDHASSLAYVAARLPFAVDDYDAARDAFARWRRTGAPADRETVEVWAYGYVLWYLYAQFARERTASPCDLDRAVDQAVGRVLGSFDAVQAPDRFPNYVSKVCRNVLLTHRARRTPADDPTGGEAAEWPTGADGYDLVLVRQLVGRAVDGLPPAIREVARMRFLDGRPYAEIAEATGRPIDSVRTYASKAAARLRQSPDLRDLLEDP